jgi:hypothetical protein
MDETEARSMIKKEVMTPKKIHEDIVKSHVDDFLCTLRPNKIYQSC